MQYNGKAFDRFVKELKSGKTVWQVKEAMAERARVILPVLRNCPPRSKYRSKLDKKKIWHAHNEGKLLRYAETYLTWAEYHYWDGHVERFSIIGMDERAVARELERRLKEYRRMRA
jgi:hypothetical protein